MKTNITKLFRLTAYALLLTLLSSCSDDTAEVSAENAGGKSQIKKDAGASKTLDRLTPKGNSDTHSHAINDQNAKPDAVTDYSSELNDDPLSEGSLVEDEYGDEPYYEPARTVSIDSAPSEGFIRWEQPQNLVYTNAKITISSGSGETIIREFNAGESIELYGELPDGIYGWESVITPQVDESVRAEMRAVRSSGDINAERELAARLRAQGSLPTEQEARDNVQSGSFIVLNGVVNPRGIDEQSEVE